MAKKLYDLTPEHEALFPEWLKKWTGNAMSTKAMDADDKIKCVDAVNKMYALAKLKPPRVVFVSSPFIMRFAAGFASAIWHMRKNKKMAATTAATTAATGAATTAATWAATRDATRDATGDATGAATTAATWAATGAATTDATGAATRAATRDATGAATRDATGAATRAATWAATGAATWAATRAATRDATGAATGAATWAATRDATRAATWAATRAATWAATRAAKNKHSDNADDSKWYSGFDIKAMIELNSDLGLGELGLSCAENAFNMYQGGNQWSDVCAFYTFFRDVAKLDIDWSVYEPWNVLCEHSGPRIVHEEFCIISDRPEVLSVNDMNEPHNEAGPFCKWRDGSELYSVNGVRVPKWVVSRPEAITTDKIAAEENSEIRRIMIERMGHAKYLHETGAKEIHSDSIPIGGGIDGFILRSLIVDKHGAKFLCGHDGSTERIYFMSVDPQAKTCREAHESICGFDESLIIANA